jgi:hypothetical protein
MANGEEIPGIVVGADVQDKMEEGNGERKKKRMRDE